MNPVPERIEREVFIAAPLAKVWATVTEAEHIGAWFGDAGAEIDLRPGGRMVLSWEEYGQHTAVIERVDPPTFLSWRWTGPGGDDPASANSTLVEFTLTPHGGGTRLRVNESGFQKLPIPADEQAEYAEGNIEGWRIELGELAEYAQGLSRT